MFDLKSRLRSPQEIPTEERAIVVTGYIQTKMKVDALKVTQLWGMDSPEFDSVLEETNSYITAIFQAEDGNYSGIKRCLATEASSQKRNAFDIKNEKLFDAIFQLGAGMEQIAKELPQSGKPIIINDSI